MDRPIVDDGEPSIQLFNQELVVLEAQGKNTWFNAPWLYAESVPFPHHPTSFTLTPLVPGAICKFDAPRSPAPDPRPFFRYRLVRGYFIETKALEYYDPFASQKMDTFQKSGNGVYRSFLI